MIVDKIRIEMLHIQTDITVIECPVSNIGVHLLEINNNILFPLIQSEAGTL